MHSPPFDLITRPTTPLSSLPLQKSQRRFKEIRLPEEWIEEYRPGGLHPIHLEDTLKEEQYRVCRKLGYGAFSTVWLAIDTKNSCYVALKICSAGSSSGAKEIAIYDYFESNRKSDTDDSKVVKLVEHFTHQGPNGSHICLVFEAMGPSVHRMMESLPAMHPGSSAEPTFPLWMAKRILIQLLQALEALHARGIVHGDVQYGNLLFTLRPDVVSGTDITTTNKLKQEIDATDSDLAHVERVDGLADLWAPKYLISSAPLNDFVDLSHALTVKLSDFGSSFFLTDSPTRTATPAALRSPEQILGLGLDQKTDIWSFGCLLYQTLTGSALFPIIGFAFTSPNETEDDHMVELINTLGPMPIDIRSHWVRHERYYNSEGKQIRFSIEEDKPSQFSSNEFNDEAAETQMEEDFVDEVEPATLEDKFSKYKMEEISDPETQVILDLLRMILVYEAEDRPTAAELLQHPWFAEMTL